MFARTGPAGEIPHVLNRKPEAPFFLSDDLEARLARRRLDEPTRRFVRQMAQDGGAPIDLGPGAIALCDQAIAETEHYFRDGGTSRVQDAWRRSPAVRRLANLPSLRKFLAAAYGRKPFGFQTLNFQRGSQQHFHSDRIHFSSIPEHFMCGVWIALEDVRPGSGELMYKLGSHRLPVLEMGDLGVDRDQPSDLDYEHHYVPRFAELLDESSLPTATAMIRKGQAFVWAANLAHGGSPILDPNSTRRSLVVHFYFEGCIYYTPRLSNTDGRRLQLRLPADLRTGGWAWPSRNGRPLLVSRHLIREAFDAWRKGEPFCS
jgi:hypothetical protein